MKYKKHLLNPAFIPLCYGLISIIILHTHDTFEEWDGVAQLYEGQQILNGSGYIGWGSYFWPPLYSVLTGFLSLIFPGFFAAKLVSVISSVILVWIVYYLAFEICGSKKVALVAQLFISVNPIYNLLSIQAENHMLDTLFFTGTFLFLIKSLKASSDKLYFISGLLAGFACLTRYTSYILVPCAFISIILSCGLKRSIKHFLYFAASFTVVSLPWWVANTIQNGSPLYSMQYLNIGCGIFKGNSGWWWWYGQDSYKSIKDIFLGNAELYINNFVNNLKKSMEYIFDSLGVLHLFPIPVLIYVTIKKEYRQAAILVLTGMALFILLVSQAFVFEEVFLSWAVILTVLCIIAICDCCRKVAGIFYNLNKIYLYAIVFTFLIVIGFQMSEQRITQYLKYDDIDGGQLVDYKEVCNTLIKVDDKIQEKSIMSIHPARSYYVGSGYLMLPTYYLGTVDGIVKYEGLSEKVINYAPKYKCGQKHSDYKADYLIYDEAAKALLPQFAFLFDKDSKDIPENFQLIYHSDKVVVYKIHYD